MGPHTMYAVMQMTFYSAASVLQACSLLLMLQMTMSQNTASALIPQKQSA